MSDNAQMDAIKRYARLIEKQTGKAVRPYRMDGYVNLMNRYGTSKDPSEHYNFQREPDIPDDVLTTIYEGNGLFAKIIDTPAEEAIKHGFTLKDVSDKAVEEFVTEALDELDWEELAMTAIRWTRLFGGAIAVMLINDGGRLEDPLNWRKIKSIDDIRVYERVVVQPEYESMFNYDPTDPFSTRGSRLGMPEYYQVCSRYGNFRVHDSRCLVFQNGVLPENATNSLYRLWGIPEYIRIHRALKDAELAHESAPKLLDRSVQAIYKMKGLSQLMATEQGESQVLRRLQVIDMARGMLNSLVIDSEGEDYDFKTFQFNGITDVVSASCNMLSAITSIPQTILFGQGVGGLSTTDDTSMENYYNYIERIQKRMLRKNLRYLLSIIFQAGLYTGEVDEVPKLNVEFNPLWSLNDTEQATLEQQKAATELTKAQTAQAYIQMEAIDPSEVRKGLADSDEFDVETLLDELDDGEEDLFSDMPDMEGGAGSQNPPESGTGPQKIFEPGHFADYAEGVDVKEHDTDPGKNGSPTPASAPAATKLPQDMSDEEKLKAAEAPTNPDKKPDINAQGDGNTTSLPDNAKPTAGSIVVNIYGDSFRVKEHNDADDDDVDWITVNGAHIPLNQNGEAIGGAEGALKGKNFERAAEIKKIRENAKKPVAFKPTGEPKKVTTEALKNCPVGSVLYTEQFGLWFTKVEEDGKKAWATMNGNRIEEDFPGMEEVEKSMPGSYKLYEGDGKPANLYIPKMEADAPIKPKPDKVIELPEDHKFGGHEAVNSLPGDRGLKDIVKRVGGLSSEEASLTLNGLIDYTGKTYCGAIKQLTDTGEGLTRLKDEALALDRYCKNAPTWNGGPLYRGISGTSPTHLLELKRACESGEAISMHGISSWSSEEHSAMKFAGGSNSVTGKTMLRCKEGSSWGTSVDVYSQFDDEHEVLVCSEARYKVSGYHDENGVMVFDLIEANPRVKHGEKHDRDDESDESKTDDLKAGVGVLVLKEGKVLAGTRESESGYGLICGPGGHIKVGETPTQAAFRETEEEFGISPTELIPIGRGPAEPDTGIKPYVFVCTEYHGDLHCVDGEMKDPKFLSLDEIEQLKPSLFQPFSDGVDVLKAIINNDDPDPNGPDHDDGGPGSGNHGHKGVEGQVGGSAPSGDDPLTARGPIKDRLKKLGHSQESIDRARALFEKHSGNSGSDQAEADAEIAKHISDDDDIGKMLKDKAQMESQVWRDQIADANVKAKHHYEEELDDIRQMIQPGGALSNYTEDDLKDLGMWPKEPEATEPKFYRKGGMDKDVLAFTTDPNGANMSHLTNGESGSIGSDQQFTLDQMKEMGYLPIAGIQSMDVGQVGESEVLFAKFPSSKAHVAPYAGETSHGLDESVYSAKKSEWSKNAGRELSDREVQEMVDAASDYTRNYKDVVAASAGYSGVYATRGSLMDSEEKATAEKSAAAIEKAISLSDKYAGTTKRAMTMDKDAFDKFIAESSGDSTFGLGHLSSWSTGDDALKRVFRSRDGDDPDSYNVVLECKSKSGVSIKDVADVDMDEVLYSKKARFKVLDTDPDYSVGKYKAVKLTLEEVGNRGDSSDLDGGPGSENFGHEGRSGEHAFYAEKDE